MSGRHIETHKVNGLNEQICIRVMDDPGPGGANHRYCLYQPHDAFNEELNANVLGNINFQNGPISEAGVNGVSNEAVLAVVRDRLEGFQSGPFACPENAHALVCVIGAMTALQSRTKERAARGVEGTLLKAILFCVAALFCGEAIAGGPCYTGVCRQTYSAPVYHAPAYHAPAVYHAPVVEKVVHPPTAVTIVLQQVAYDKPLALQGSSVYGYTKVADVFVPIDSALYLDKSERLVTQALEVARQGRTGFDDAVRDQIQAQKEIAQSLAVGQVAREIVESISKAERQRAALAAGNAGVLSVTAEPTTATGVLQARCVSCHQSYNDWGKLDRDDQLKLIGRVITAESGKRMPKAADKQSVGESLTPEELGLLYQELKKQ